jgi:hypothetical protein
MEETNSSSQRRLFAGVKIPAPPALCDALVTLQTQLARERIRWVPPENWHLTLEFFGAVPESRIPALAAALAGVDVVILAENSTASPPTIRRVNVNFAAALAQDGVQTLLWSGTNKALHKKLVIVDGRLLLLGSSNLSLSGTYGSIEMNILTEDPRIVQPAIADFQRLRSQLQQRQAAP